MKVSLDSTAILGARAKACCLKTMVTVIRDRQPLLNHGMTAAEVRQFFPRVNGFALTTYGNRLRDLVNEDTPRAGRHDVHNERHFWPVCLDEDGLIRHDSCRKCQKP